MPASARKAYDSIMSRRGGVKMSNESYKKFSAEAARAAKPGFDHGMSGVLGKAWWEKYANIAVYPA